MPISLRLPNDMEAQLAGLSLRQKTSKSALIVRSITEFLQRHNAPTSQEIYDQALRSAGGTRVSTQREPEERTRKLAVRDAVLHKAAQRRTTRSKTT
jgi:predicted transcriptional regulator